MFSKRADGHALKKLDPFNKALAYVMPRRSDALVYFTEQIDCKYLDEYIAKRKEDGIDLSYLDIITAAMMRVHALRPYLNRFVMNGRIFARNELTLSIALKKSLCDDAAETTVKLHFTGHENIFDTKQMFDKVIRETKDASEENITDKLAARIMNGPVFLVKWLVWLCKLLDRWNMMPKAFIDASPFHATVFVTYLKSLGINSVYHHIYDFGTVSMFIGIGKERLIPVVDDRTGEVRAGKVIELKVVADERICDGLYHARSMRLIKKYLANPEMLEDRLEKVEREEM